MSYRFHGFALFTSLVLGACSCGGGDKTPPCEGASPLPGCGETCSAVTPCPNGLHCAGSTCTADCTASGDQCDDGQSCTNDGRCVVAHDSGTDGQAGDGGGGGDGGEDGSMCNDLMVTADPVRPYIIFIIDRSGSMKELYPPMMGANCGTPGACLSRWQSTRDVLLGSPTPPLDRDGVIEGIAEFAHVGMVQYTGDGSGENNATFTGLWPDLKETPAALANVANLSAAFLPFSGTQANSIEPPNVGDTPTGESIYATLCHLRPPYDNTDNACNQLDIIQDDINSGGPVFPMPAIHRIGAPANPLLPADPGSSPVIFVLATDGEPDSSWAPDGNSTAAQRFSLEAVRAARTASNDLGVSIPTYVISLALDSPHLRELACEGGTGVMPDDDRPGNTALHCTNPNPATSGTAIQADNATVLRNELLQIVRDSIPCSFQLEGRINDVEAALEQGEVTLNGQPVPADPDDGWGLADDMTFVLNGDACDTFRNTPGSSLNATFPCDGDVIIIIE